MVQGVDFSLCAELGVLAQVRICGAIQEEGIGRIRRHATSLLTAAAALPATTGSLTAATRLAGDDARELAESAVKRTHFRLNACRAIQKIGIAGAVGRHAAALAKRLAVQGHRRAGATPLAPLLAVALLLAPLLATALLLAALLAAALYHSTRDRGFSSQQQFSSATSRDGRYMFFMP